MAEKKEESKLSNLFGKYKDRLVKAHEEHKNDEVEYSSFGNLPPGIDDGIAKLVEAKIGTYKEGPNKGEHFFYAAGVVLSPQEHTYTEKVWDQNLNKVKDGRTKTVRCANLRTSIMEPLCDTQTQSGTETSFEDHFANFYQHLKRLGVNTADLDVDDPEEFDSLLKAYLDNLVEEAPTFNFRTWAGKPTKEYPRSQTRHTWGELCAPPEEPDESVHTEDNTAVEETEEEVKSRFASPVNRLPTGTPIKAPVAQGTASKSSTPTNGQKGSTGQAKAATRVPAKAEGKEGKASVKMPSVAKQAVQEFNEFENPNEGNGEAQVAESEQVSETEEETQEGSTFNTGEVCGYTPIDPKTKKPVKSPVECVIESVDEAKGLYVLRSLLDGKTMYKNVPLDKLQVVS